MQRGDGSWIASLTNLAIHATALDARNLLYSADVTGSIQRAFEQALHTNNPAPDGRRPVVLFVNGAEGDVEPSQQGTAGMEEIGMRFARQAIDNLLTAQAVVPDWSVARADVKLGRARFNMRACAQGNVFKRMGGGLMNLFVPTAFPRKTEVWTVRLGDQLMLGWPGEPITSLGLSLKAATSGAMARQTWVLGLTNDHLSYFVDPAEYKTNSYEACSTLYGPEGGNKIIQAFKSLLGL